MWWLPFVIACAHSLIAEVTAQDLAGRQRTFAWNFACQRPPVQCGLHTPGRLQRRLDDEAQRMEGLKWVRKWQEMYRNLQKRKNKAIQEPWKTVRHEHRESVKMLPIGENFDLRSFHNPTIKKLLTRTRLAFEPFGGLGLHGTACKGHAKSVVETVILQYHAIWSKVMECNIN